MDKSGSLFFLVVAIALVFVVGVYAIERYRAHCERENSSVGCYFSELDK